MTHSIKNIEHAMECGIDNYATVEVVSMLRALLEENKRLKSENAHQHRSNKMWQDTHKDLESELEHIQRDKETLIESLRWYAHPETYEIKGDDDSDPPHQPYTDITRDNGDRARSILKELEVSVYG